MKFFMVGTILVIFGSVGASTLSVSGGPGHKGVPKDMATTITAGDTTVDPCRLPEEGGLQDSEKMVGDQVTTATLGCVANDTIQAVARNVIIDTDETGRETGKKAALEKMTETDGKKTVVTEKGENLPTQETPEVTSVASENVTGKGDASQKVERTEKTKVILPGNETKEVSVTETEEKLPSLTSTKETTVESKNVTDKGDGLQKVERTEKTKETLPGNKTKEVSVTETEEKLPSQETIKEVTVESKNVTDEGDGLQKVERTEKTKEILLGNETKGVSVTEVEENVPSKETLKVTTVESKNVTDRGDGLQTVERTEKTKEILPGNKTKEVAVTKTEEKLPSHQTIKEVTVESKLATDKSDDLQKVERTEKTKEILPGNKTKEVSVTETEEKLPSHETIKEVTVESKNVTDKTDGQDVEKETLIEKEVTKDVCESSVKEVRDEKHLDETVEDLKRQIDEMKTEIEELKSKAEEIKSTRGLCLILVPCGDITIEEVGENLAPAATPAEVFEKVLGMESLPPDGLLNTLPFGGSDQGVVEGIAPVVEKELTTEE